MEKMPESMKDLETFLRSEQEKTLERPVISKEDAEQICGPKIEYIEHKRYNQA